MGKSAIIDVPKGYEEMENPRRESLSARGKLITKDFEGFESLPYMDHVKDDKDKEKFILTVGYGFNLDDPSVQKLMPEGYMEAIDWQEGSGKPLPQRSAELSKDEANGIFDTLYKRAHDDAIKYIGGGERFNKLDADTKDNLVDMSYNLGYDKLSGFDEMKEELIKNDKKGIAREMKDSVWHGQTGRRSRHHVETMEGKREFLDLSMFNIFEVKDAGAASEISDASEGYEEMPDAPEGFEEVGEGEALTKDPEQPNYWKHVGKEFGESASQFVGALKTAGQAITKIPASVGAAVLKAHQGAEGASVVDKGWIQKTLQDAGEDNDEFVKDIYKKYEEKQAIRGIPIKITDIAELPQNIAFSITSMGAGLATGVPIAFIPLPGARVAAWATGTAASGKAAFEMATYEIMQEYLEAKNEESIESKGREITKEEEVALKKGFNAEATKYGLWEAVPEALSNLAFAGILAAPLAKMAGKTIATRIVSKLAGLYGEELLTETITQKGQVPIEQRAGLREGDGITWVQALKEVAPQTFLLTSVMAGAGASAIAIKNKVMPSLAKEIKNTKITPEQEKIIRQELEEHIDKVIQEKESTGIKVEGEIPGKEELPPVATDKDGKPIPLEVKPKEPISLKEEEKVTPTPTEKPIVEPSEELQGKQGLVEEAKKYKTAEEFVKALDEGQAGLYVDYTPIKRLLESNIGNYNLAKVGFKSNEYITIYRGIDDPTGKVKRQISAGDYVATTRELAESYVGSSKDVVSMKIKAKDFYLDEDPYLKDDFGGEFTPDKLEEISLEGVYNPNTPITKQQLTDIWEKAQEKKEGLDLKQIIKDVGDALPGAGLSVEDVGREKERGEARKRIAEQHIPALVAEAKRLGMTLKAYLEKFTDFTKDQIKYLVGQIKTVKKEDEEKVSKLSKSITDEAIEEGLIEEFGDLPTYATRNMEDVAEKAVSFIENDYEKAKKIALGEAPEQGDLRAQELFTAIRIKAVAEGDIDTIEELALSKTASAIATELGQRIKALDAHMTFDPVKTIQKIVKEREEVVKRTPASEKEIANYKKRLEETEARIKELEDNIKDSRSRTKKAEGFGSKNRIFTQARVDTARASLKLKLSGLHAGVDPTAVVELTEIGGFYFEGGIQEFGAWSKMLVKEFGDVIKPHLNDIWKNVRKEYGKSQVEDVKERIGKLSAEKDNQKLAFLTQKLAEGLISSGVVTRGNLVKEVHKILQDSYPDITFRETADLISGYGKYNRLSQDRIKQILRDIKGQLQQISKLEDMQKGQAPLKTGVERRSVSDEERRLIKLVEEAKKKYNIKTTDPATQLKSALDAKKTTLRNQIKDLEKQIIERKKIIKNKTSLKLDAEANALMKRRDELMREFKAIFAKPKKSRQEISLQSLKTRLTNEAERLNDKLDAMDFEVTAKREIVLDVEAQKLKQKRDQIKNAFNAARYAQEGITKNEITNIVNLTKEASEAQSKVVEKDDWTADNAKDVEDYFDKRNKMEEYVESLRPKNVGDVVNKFFDYFRASILASPRILRNSFLYQVVPGIERTITKRLVTGAFSDADLKSNIVEKLLAKLSGIKPSGKSLDFVKRQTAMATRIYHNTGIDISRLDKMDSTPKFFGERVGKFAGKGLIGKFAKFVSLAPKWFAGGTDMLFANIGRADTSIMMSKEIAKIEALQGKLPDGMTQEQRADQLLKDSYSFTPKDKRAATIRAAGIMDAHMMNNTQPGWWSDKVIEFRRMMSIGKLNFGKVLIPFAKIANVVVAEGVKTATGYGIAKSMYDINVASRKSNIKDRAKLMRSAVTDLVRYVGLSGAALLISAFLDDDDYIGAYNTIGRKDYELARARNAGTNYVRIGGKWIALRYLPMINIPISAIMTVRQAKRKGGNPVSGYLVGILGQIMDSPGIKEISSLTSNIKYSLKKDNLEAMAKSMKMDTDGISNWAKVRMIPSVLSYDVWNALFPKAGKYDFMGREIERGVFKDDKSNDITLEFNRLADSGNFPTISKPTGKYAVYLEEQLGEEEYSKILSGLQKEYAKQVDSLIDSKRYKGLSDEDKRKRIDKIRKDEILKELSKREKKLKKQEE